MLTGHLFATNVQKIYRMERFSHAVEKQLENSTDGGVLWLAEYFNWDHLEKLASQNMSFLCQAVKTGNIGIKLFIQVSRMQKNNQNQLSCSTQSMFFSISLL